MTQIEMAQIGMTQMTKQIFFDRKQGTMFMDDPAAIADYCMREWPGECSHILRVADQVCRSSFLFDLKQDLERTWEPVEFPEGRIDWGYMPGDDKEFIFQFNRHRFFICLGQAYQMTGDEKYAGTFVNLLMDWIGTQTLTPETENTTWRILEAGFRGEFWVKAIWYFKDSQALTDQVMDAFYKCLIQHAEYIIRMHSPYRYISNWGVIENHGLFEIGVAMPDDALRKRYVDTALSHLEMEARIQIMGDGVQWEQSPSYHNEVLHCYEDVLVLAQRNHIHVPESIRSAVRKMAYANLAWKKPDHRQFLMGDSDDGDIRDTISAAAWLFHDPVLKFGASPCLEYDMAWDLGIRAAKEYRDMETAMPEFQSAALEDSGNYYLRDGWGEEGNLLHFHCGTMGAGHGHSDQLHVDLVIGGEDVLTDAGRFTYVPGPDRFAFKDPTAHNTITVDNRFFTVCRDSWECSKLCAPVKRQHRFTEQYELVQGAHLGYMDREDAVAVNRRIIHIKPDIYIVTDELYTGGSHEYRQYWHFSEKGRVTLRAADKRGQGRTAADTAETGAGTGPSLEAEFWTSHTRALFSFLGSGLEAEKGASRIARDYNRAVDRDCITVKADRKGFSSLLTVIQGGPGDGYRPCEVEKVPVKSALKGITYPDSMAEAVRLKGNGRDYVAVICHQEVNSPTDMVEAEGCMGFGTIIVFDRNREALAGTVLDY